MPLNPGFYICNSNDLDNLAVSAAYLMRTYPPRHPLALEQVVVMNRGMQTYLTQFTARCNGISAQCEYQQVWQLIFKIHRLLHPGADPRNLFSRLYLTLNILGLKPRWAQKPAAGKPDYFKKMREYLENDAVGDKAYLLSARLADTLDQYQMYRPQWVREWNSWNEDDFELFARDREAPGKIRDFIAGQCRKDPRAAKALASNVWQMHLWCLLRSNLSPKPLAQGAGVDTDLSRPLTALDDPLLFLDRVGVMDNLQALLRSREVPAERFANLPDKVFIFGVSALPPQVIDFLQALSGRCAVFLLLLNPCRQYWGDLSSSFAQFFARFKKARALKVPQVFPKKDLFLKKTVPDSPALPELKDSMYSEEGELQEGNALLLGLGRQGMDNLSLLCALEPMPQFIDSFTDPETDSVLHTLQHQLLTLQPLSAGRVEIATDDCSFEIHSCHTRLREVEAVRDAILRRFAAAQERGEKLLPRDIVVMVPAINDYAPYITAVFGTTQSDLENEVLPYAICDRTQGEESPVSGAVLSLLNLSSERISSVLVTDLLSIEALSQRFGIVPDDIRVLEQWFSAGAVFWGLDDADTREESDIPLPGTFERGLDRMLLGTMAGEIPGSGAFAEIEGDDALLLGKLCAFIAQLKELRAFFTPHLQLRPEEWRQHLEARILDNFFVFDEDNQEERSAILQAVDKVQEICRDLKNAPLITLPVFHALLQGQLSAERNYQPFLRGKVNFCSLVPMRAVPFKHIFILGLNDGEFPRRERMPGFNLLSLSSLYQRGDRSRAQDDRFLFLDALISARESIYFSYIGESPVSQQELSPSVVLTELLDYLSSCFKVGPDGDGSLTELRRRLIVKDHLAAYHPDNYVKVQEAGTMPRLPSFDRSSCVPLQEKNQERGVLGLLNSWQAESPEVLQLDLQELSFCLSDPPRAFLQGVLKINLKADLSDELSADEDFERSAFDNAFVVRQMLESDAKDAALLLQGEERSGRLPFGVFGTLNVAEIVQTTDILRKALQEYCGADSLSALKTVRLTGSERVRELDGGGSLRIILSGECKVAALSVPQLLFFYPFITFRGVKSVSSKVLLQAFGCALTYYAATGQGAPCLLLDGAGQVLHLNPLTGAEYESALNEALDLYLMSRQRPLPCCDALLRFYQQLKPEDDVLAKISAKDNTTVSPEFSYLFGSQEIFVKSPELWQLFLRQAHFYEQYIFTRLEDGRA